MKDRFRMPRTLLCVVLALTIPFAFAGCKDKTEKLTEKLSDKYLSDRHVEEKYKDPDGKVAFKVDCILPELDDSDNPRYSSFNKIMDSIVSESESSAKTVIANKIYEKGKPWKETGGYTVPYADYHYISVLIELQREASSGNISEYPTAFTFSLDSGKQCSLADFGKVSSDYLQTQLAKAVMTKISDSGAAVPELSVIRSAFDMTDFVLTPQGFDLYITKISLSGFSGVENHYGFTFDEVANLLDLPNVPEQ